MVVAWSSLVKRRRPSPTPATTAAVSSQMSVARPLNGASSVSRARMAPRERRRRPRSGSATTLAVRQTAMDTLVRMRRIATHTQIRTY